MNDPIGPWELARARYERLRHEAEIERLLADAGIEHTSLQARMLHRLGALLLACGQRLAPAPTAAAHAAADVPPTLTTTLPGAPLAEWHILANGDIITSLPAGSPAAAPLAVTRDAPATLVVRMERAPEGSMSIACWSDEPAGQPSSASERHVAVFYVTREPVLAGAS